MPRRCYRHRQILHRLPYPIKVKKTGKQLGYALSASFWSISFNTAFRSCHVSSMVRQIAVEVFGTRAISIECPTSQNIWWRRE